MLEILSLAKEIKEKKCGLIKRHDKKNPGGIPVIEGRISELHLRRIIDDGIMSKDLEGLLKQLGMVNSALLRAFNQYGSEVVKVETDGKDMLKKNTLNGEIEESRGVFSIIDIFGRS